MYENGARAILERNGISYFIGKLIRIIELIYIY